VPEKGSCCVSGVSGEVFPQSICGFVPCFHAGGGEPAPGVGAAAAPSAADPGKRFPRAAWDGVEEGEEGTGGGIRPRPPLAGLPAVRFSRVFPPSPFPTGEKLNREQQVASAAPGTPRSQCPFPPLHPPLCSGTRFEGRCGASRVRRARSRRPCAAPAEKREEEEEDEDEDAAARGWALRCLS